MFRMDACEAMPLSEGMTRRDFLHAGALSLLGASLILPEFPAMRTQGDVRRDKDINCIMLVLLGGPSQLDTWDMKPNAPVEIRGPFQPIKTSVPNIEISELFPRMAKRAELFSIVRSMYHPAEAVTHDTGHRRMQTGRLFEDGREYPTMGSVVQYAQGSLCDIPAQVILPQMDADFQQAYTPLASVKMRESFDIGQEPDSVRDKYGRNKFGQSCLLARRMVERGVRFVTVNMFESVFNEVTWDIHGSAPFPAIDAYRTLCGPWFDNGYTSLIEELKERGLYDNTIVIATGEFGRTPRINATGGRDHWPHCWSLILGGGGIKGGQIVGASDDIGAYPIERPTTPADIAATLYAAMGMDLTRELTTPCGRPVPIVDHAVHPIHELL